MISIILPAYNAERYITECIDSVLNQTFQNWELIIVDDGSTDKTESIAEEYSTKNSKIKYYRITNGGVSNARNFGLSKAGGEYVFFLDADDFLEKGCLENAIKASTENNADIVVLAHYEFDEMNNICKKNEKFTETELLSDGEIERTFLMTDKIGWEVWGKLYSREILDNILFEKDLRIAEDAVFLCTALTKSEHVLLLKEYGYYYRMNVGSVMAQSFNEKNMDILKAISKMEQLVKDSYPFEAEAFKMKYYIWFLRRYNIKISQKEKNKYINEIKTVKKNISEKSIKEAFSMLSKKYALEFIMIKYFYFIYGNVVKILNKFNVI